MKDFVKFHIPKLFRGWIFVLICGQITGQNVTITGLVIDGTNDEILPGATIQIGDFGTYTDLNGEFNLQMNSGVVALSCSFVGYDIWHFNGHITKDTFIQIEMVPAENILEAATVTASKFSQSLAESTISIDILRPELIEGNSPSSVESILNKSPGLTMIEGQANIRGGSGFSYGAGSRVLLLVDNMPALQADAGFPNWKDLPLENIGQIEIVKGAASALYGSSALNGIINLRTDFAGTEPETKVSTFYTQYLNPKDSRKKWWSSAPSSFTAQATHKQKFKNFDLAVGAFYNQTHSFRQEVEEEYFRFSFKTRYYINDQWLMGLNGVLNTGFRNNYFYWANDSTGAYIGSEGTHSETEFDRHFFDPFLVYYQKNGDKHHLQTRFSRVDNVASAGRSNLSSSKYLEYQYQSQWEQIRTQSVTGITYNHSSVQAMLYGDTTFTANNWALFWQLDKKVWERISLSAGFRYEVYNLIGPSEIGDIPIDPKVTESKPVWRFGANWKILPYTYLRSSWGQGYRFPTIAEKFVRTTFGASLISPNPELQSETGWSGEFGLKQGFKLWGWQGFFDLSAFWSEYDNMMEFVFTGFSRGFQSQNIGDTRIKGLEFTVAGNSKLFGIPMNLLAGYTLLDPKFKNFTEEDKLRSSVDYNILKYRNKHSFKMDWSANFNQFKCGFAHNYLSKMEAMDSILEVVVPGLKHYRERNGGFGVWDTRVSYEWRAFTGTIILNNIFNREYSVRPGLLDAPRNWTIRLDMKI